MLANIAVVDLQQVVGDEADGTVPTQRAAHLFASESSLQHIESEGLAVVFFPADDLSIQHCSGWKGIAQCHQLREAVVDQFLTSAPEINAITSMNQLPADAIPLPLQQPIGRLRALNPFSLQWTGQEKRVRPTTVDLFLSICWCRQRAKAFS